MVAGTGNSPATLKSAANRTPALISTVMNSKKRKSDSNPTNIADKFRLNDPLLRHLSSAAAVTRHFLETNDLFLPPSQSIRLESLVSSLRIAPSPSTSTATWFNRFLTSAAGDDDPRWYLCFRMSKYTFFHLLSILSSSEFPSLPSSCLAATIFRLAHNASYNSLVLRFGFDSVPHASRAFFTVCKLINEKLGQLDDPKPDYSPRLLPNCCGVLGFGRFEVDGKLLGSKGSLIVQALIDSDGRFADISAGWPSTMKPEAIFRQTKLFTIAEETESESRSFLKGALCKLGNGISVHRYILGDSCLPLLPWLVTPYNSSSSNEEEDSFESSRRDFNNVVHTALHSVYVAFAKVRARWLILDRKWKPETIEFLPFVITTCCLLHNFLVSSGDDDDDDSQEELVNGVANDNSEVREDEEDEDETRKSEGEAYIGSRRTRDAIAENLSRVISTNIN